MKTKIKNLQTAENILFYIQFLNKEIAEIEQILLRPSEINLLTFSVEKWGHRLEIKKMALNRLKIRYNNLLKNNLFKN